METALVVSSVVLWPVVLANVFLTLALVRRLNHTGQGAIDIGLKAGTKAPDFSAQTLQGATKTLADYVNRALVLIFVSPSCAPCRERLPMLQKTAVDARASGVELVLISGGTVEDTQVWGQEVDIQLPILVAPQAENTFFHDYQIKSTPTYCMLGPDGNVKGSSIVGENLNNWKVLAKSNVRAPARI